MLTLVTETVGASAFQAAVDSEVAGVELEAKATVVEVWATALPTGTVTPVAVAAAPVAPVAPVAPGAPSLPPPPPQPASVEIIAATRPS